MDLNGISDVCSYNMICSGANDKQTIAIAQAVEDHCRTKLGVKPIAVEGKSSGHWVLLDYGYTMVHVFYDYIRDYYSLEELWSKAKFVDLPK